MTLLETITSVEIGLIYGIVAIGIYLTFKVLDFPDLTCDGSFTAGAAACAAGIQLDISPGISLLFACIVGGASGLLTGVLNRYCKISALLSGILTSFMLYSINLRIMGDVPNITISTEYVMLSSPMFLMVSAAVVWLVISYFLNTDFGLGVRCLGQNPRLAIAQGISHTFYTITMLVLSNLLVGLGGGLFVLHQGFADISQGVGTIIMGLAAIMVGSKLLPDRPIYIDVLSCILGSILYRIIVALSLHSDWLGLSSSDLNLLAICPAKTALPCADSLRISMF